MCQVNIDSDIEVDDDAGFAVALVNSWDVWHADPERLPDVPALAAWLGRHGHPAGELTEADLRDDPPPVERRRRRFGW